MRSSSWTRYLLLTICLLGLGCDEASSRVVSEARSQAPRLRASQKAAPAAPTPQRDSGAALESPNRALAGAMGPADATPRLETQIQREGETWTARWRITNSTSEPIYLVTQLPTLRGGEQVPAPQAIYRRAEEETLYLTKRLWRVPAAVDPLITMVPFLIRLEPGQVHAGGVRIPAAIRESYPYQDGYQRAGIARLVVSFGYFDAAAKPSASPKQPGLYRVPYSALTQQRYLTSEPASVRLVVR